LQQTCIIYKTKPARSLQTGFYGIKNLLPCDSPLALIKSQKEERGGFI